MIGYVSTSRRANAFAQALEEHDQEGAEEAVEGDDPEHSTLLALTAKLDALPKPELAAEARSVQRAQLVAAMEHAVADGALGPGGGRFTTSAPAPAPAPGETTAPAPVPEQRDPCGGGGQHRAPALSAMARLRPHSRLGRGIAAGGLGVGMAAGALGGAAMASTDALPGDNLYGLKRGIEDIRTDLTGDEAERGQLYLDHAATRMRETRRLMERARGGDLDSDGVRSVRKALSGMRHDAAEGHRLLSAAYAEDGRLGRMESLSAFSQRHRDRWSQLRDRLPGQLSDLGAEVSSVFEAMDEEVRSFRALLPPGPGGRAEGDDRAPVVSEEAGKGGTKRPSPSDSASGGDRTAKPERSPEPSESDPSSRSTDGGLLGEDGLLDPDLPPEVPSGPPSDAAPGSQSGAVPDTDVPAPPVLPELLPGLGVEGGQQE
ncbi:DUF5667 domain-containing protein [Streptomyces oceani]|uniref:DUF5667 domain-containing protein n=1 Tax=Streptomyces oceani TaxID=1075402 RepID=A0A1E7KHS9_9ACTN|nr:DUF5667 domain-containing protein [Streptomyces oceani]OEV03404.1 hypothetical protein AN216_11845 [Streptomyces oceani]